jgi:murein DD-endopeptidase MepM/ murein hydrolase activator NlpD
MNQNQKKMQMNRALSIALSLLVVVAICVTVIAVVSARRAKPGDKANSSSSSSSSSQTTQRPHQTENTESSSKTEPVIVEKLSFIAPVTAGNVINEWSADIPVFSDTMEDYRVHLGIDVEADIGTPVYAVADGTIESVSFDPMMGQTVVIAHASGYKSIYQNMQTAVPTGIEEGKAVKAGDEIGSIGDTALIEIAEDPHLHFELYKDDLCENPLAHFKLTPIEPSTRYEDN